MVEVLSVYKQLLNSPQLLQNGFEYITKYIIEQANFVQESINLIFSGLIDQERKFIAALLKQPLIQNKSQIINLQQVYFQILRGICQEKNEQIKQLMISLLVNLGDISLLFNNNILDELPQYLNLLDVIIQYFISYSDEINKYANQIFLKIQNINDPKTIQAVYYIIQSFSHLTGCDLKQLQQCFSPTYDYWLQVFILILSQPINNQNLMIQIYTIKSLYTIFISMKSFSKNERQLIIKPLTQFLSNLSQLEIVLDDINFEEDQDFIDSDYRVDTLIYSTIQLFIQLNEQLTGNPQIYQSMIQILRLPQKQSYIDLFIDDNSQGIKRGILQFFEYHLDSKKTKLQVKALLQEIINNNDIVSLLVLDKFANILVSQNQFIDKMTLLVQSQNGLSYHCAVSIYIQSQGTLEIFNQLMSIFIALLNDPNYEILSIYNIGRLSAHAIKYNTIQNKSLDLQIKLTQIDGQYADKIYDMQIIPQFKNLYKKWPEYRHDALIITIFNEILIILAQREEYWQQIFMQFQNSPDYVWLPVHIILAKKHPELLGSNIIQLCQLFQNQNNADNFNYATMLLTLLIKSNPIDQQQLININQVLQIQMDIYQELDLHDHVHDLLLVVWIKCLNRQVTQELLNLTLLKILRTDIPLVIQGLTTILGLFFLTDPSQFIQNLKVNLEHYKILFSKWLRFSVLVQQPTQKFINQCALQQLSLYSELEFDYRDAYTSKTQPIKSKILEFIISSSIQNSKPIQKVDEEIEENEDDEYDDDGEFEDIEQDIFNESQEVDQFESNLIEFRPLLQQIQVSNINHLICYKELLPEKLQKLL
ncbi:hypothetical protein pb186bvf_011395 [Paramecium bursaria]